MIVAYLPEPETHPLWNEIQGLLRPAMEGDANILDENELVWIAFEGPVLFAAGTVALIGDDARVLACGGFEHRRWIEQAEALLMRWATDCGARKVSMRGRRGWARALVRAGWGCSPSDGGKMYYEKAL